MFRLSLVCFGGSDLQKMNIQHMIRKESMLPKVCSLSLH